MLSVSLSDGTVMVDQIRCQITSSGGGLMVGDELSGVSDAH